MRVIEACEIPRAIDMRSMACAVARAVVKDDNVIEHLPRKVSQVCSLF